MTTRFFLLVWIFALMLSPAFAQGGASGHNPMGDTDAPNAYENLQYGTAGTDAELRRNPFSGDFDLTALMQSPKLFAAAYRSAQDVADCIVEHDPEAARSVLAAGGEADAIAALVKDHRQKCNASSSTSLPADMIDGALAEALFAGAGLSLEDRAMSVNVNEAEQFSGLVPGADIDFAMIGRCIAVYSPGLAGKLIDTDAGSNSEEEALSMLYRQTPECGLRESPDGVPEVYQRAMIASGLYRWTSRQN